ncbi:hypothetical protein VPHD30_0195 [Vibrio phage D30]
MTNNVARILQSKKHASILCCPTGLQKSYPQHSIIDCLSRALGSKCG